MCLNEDQYVKDPLVTIAITNFNYSEYVLECISSALCQTYSNCEVLVYDDCSTDDSVDKILSTYSDEVRLFVGDRNQGAGLAKNACIDIAQGKYICFLDADDLLACNAIDNFIHAVGNSDVVIGRVSSFSQSGGAFRHQYINDSVDKLMETLDYCAMSQAMSACNKMYLLSYIRKYDISFSKYRVMDDALFCYEIAMNRPKVSFAPVEVLHIRQHGNSLSKVTSDDKIIEVLKVTQELCNRSHKFSFADRLRINGNNLIYFIMLNDQSMLSKVIQNRRVLSYPIRLLISFKMVFLYRSLKPLKLLYW